VVKALVVAALVAALGLLAIAALALADRPTRHAASQTRVASDRSLTAQQIRQRYGRGVVEIVAAARAGPDADGRGGRRAQPRGLGFAISGDGLILTSAALVDHNGQIAKTVGVVLRTGDAQTRRMVGAIACVDPLTGLAVIRIDPGGLGGLESLPMGDSSGLRPGQTVVALGSPLASPSLAAGTVIATGRDVPTTHGVAVSGAMITDLAAGRRDSGAPLLDASGRVVGVLEQPGARTAGGAQGLWSAAPIDGAAHVISDANTG
jgi:S1-C subfamily serine protease